MPMIDRRFLPPILLPAFSACGGGGGSTLPSVVTPTPPTPTVVNVNISNPILTVANNTAVSPSGTLNLVWSDEFDAT